MSKLKEILKYVSEHNSFYKNRIKNYNITDPLDISQWPILTRQELQENRYNMFSDGYDLMYYSKQLFHRHSSGTSGIPINVYWHPENYYASMMPLWRLRKRFYNVSAKSKCVSFTFAQLGGTVTNGLIYKKTQTELLILCSSLCTENSFKQLILLIQAFEPEWLYIQPSILANLIFYYQHFDLNPPNSISYIETAGELLSENLKRKATEFFNALVANMYGSEEMNGIAYECPNGKMHIIEDNVWVECQTADNQLQGHGAGNAIITNLNNRAMPLIRYHQGDGIRGVCLDNCACGMNGNIIANIEGRVRSNIIRNDMIITPFMLVRTVDYVNNLFNGIIQRYHFDYYLKNEGITCSLWINGIDRGWTNTIAKAITKQLQVYCIDNIEIIVHPMTKNFLGNNSKCELLTIHKE